MLTPPAKMEDLAAVEGYTRIQHLQSGAFGMAFLERDSRTGETVAIKYIPRGATVRLSRAAARTVQCLSGGRLPEAAGGGSGRGRALVPGRPELARLRLRAASPLPPLRST